MKGLLLPSFHTQSTHLVSLGVANLLPSSSNSNNLTLLDPQEVHKEFIGAGDCIGRYFRIVIDAQNAPNQFSTMARLAESAAAAAAQVETGLPQFERAFFYQCGGSFKYWVFFFFFFFFFFFVFCVFFLHVCLTLLFFVVAGRSTIHDN
jgi:hypothetical protein